MGTKQTTQTNLEEVWNFGQVRKLLGVPAHTLRRLCNSSLLPGWRHGVGVRRSFTTEQVERLRVAVGLQKAGFGMRDIRSYLNLSEEPTAEARHLCREMLMTHKRQVWQRLEELQKTIDFLERQEDMLEARMRERRRTRS